MARVYRIRHNFSMTVTRWVNGKRVLARRHQGAQEKARRMMQMERGTHGL